MWVIKYCLLITLILLVMVGCGMPDATTGTTSSNAGSNNVPNETTGTTSTNLPSTSQFSPLNIVLTMEKAPRLNEAATVTCTVKSIGHDAPNTTANINLPKGAVLISGNLNWQGDLMADIPIQFSAVIKFVEEGKWTIVAVANHEVDESYGWRADDYLNIDVRTNEGSFFEIGASMDDLIEFDKTHPPPPDEVPRQPLPDPKGEEVVPPDR